MTPEEEARVLIDEMLAEAGWAVVSRSEYLNVPYAQAVTEALTKGNHEADYLLFLDGRAIGVLEAKRKENSLGGKVAEQTAGYSTGALPWYKTWINPLPFLFMSNGDKLVFRNALDPKSEFEPIKKMLTPKQLVKLAREYGIKVDSEFAALPALPPVGPNGLRLCQHEAISALELAFKHGERRALLDIATGAGKTYTACMICYRQLTYTPVKRVLYLVDRTNLGKQTEGEFGTFRLTENGTEFNKIYSVLRLRGFDPNDSGDMMELSAANVCICTIQRLFSVLTGSAITASDDDDEANEEETFFNESDSQPEIELGNNLKLSRDFFDTIIVDECHRSIYGRWRRVLEYFNKARVIGLTATPTPQAYAFFNNTNNATYTYSREQSYIDNINVPPRVYRIKTEVSEGGGLIGAGESVKEVTKRTGIVKNVVQENSVAYMATDLDRSVVNPTQIERVITEYRNCVYENLFPDRIPENGVPDYRYIPKTLIFAKNKQHARNIIETIERVFAEKFPDGKVPEGFVQEITCAVEKPDDRIKAFRNDKNFRIAVTVTLVATGTDVKPIEVVFFMRDIHSDVLYTQMVGRGCRSIADEKLRTVTPNATTKENFVLVDAVGVTQSEKRIPNATEDEGARRPLKLAELLEHIAHGDLTDANLELLAEKCSAIYNRTSDKHKAEFLYAAHFGLRDFSLSIFDAFKKGLPEYIDINEPNIERSALVSPLINNKVAREKLLELNAGYQCILSPGEDQVTYSGFLQEDALKHSAAFEKYINEHADDIEALRIIYHDESSAITSAMLNDLQEKLLAENRLFKPPYLWDCYKVFASENHKTVIPLKGKSEMESLTNLIQLVRYAYGFTDTLQPIQGIASQRFGLYLGQQMGNVARQFTPAQIDVLRKVMDYVVQNGCTNRADLFEYDQQLALQAIQIYTPAQADRELEYFSKFLLQIKAA